MDYRLSPGESIIDPKTMKVTHHVVMRPIAQTPPEESQEARWRHYGVFVYSGTGRPTEGFWETLLISGLVVFILGLLALIAVVTK